jgi:hypothetical protein
MLGDLNPAAGAMLTGVAGSQWSVLSGQDPAKQN